MKATVKLLCSSLWIVLLCMVASGSTWRTQQPSTVLRVSPSSSRVLVGRMTTISVEIERVSGLYGAQVHLRFDPAVLEVLDADPAQDGVQVEPGTFPVPDFVVQNVADNSAGTIEFASTQMAPNKPSEGQGTVFRVDFRGRKAGASPIQIEDFLLADTQATSIGATPENGLIQVRPNPPWAWIVVIGFALAVLIGLAVYQLYRKRKRE